MNDKWTSINKASYPYFNIEIFCSENALIPESIDFAILFNSYESRSLEYYKLFKEKQIKKVLLVNFKSKRDVKKINFNINKTQLERIAEHTIELDELDIFDYHENIEKILSKIPRDSIFYKSKWFIDITGVPSVYSVALLKSIRQFFPSPKLHILNVSGVYDSKPQHVHTHFSEGYKSDIKVPFYEGTPDYSKPWKYFFLIGFEGERSLSILKINEPASCDVFYAHPGYEEEYNKTAIKNNECFLRELSYEEKDLIPVDVGDIITLSNEFERIYSKIKGEMNLCIVPLGPKPHALGAGLFGLLHPEVSIMYQVPRKYYLKESTRGKYIWLYVID